MSSAVPLEFDTEGVCSGCKVANTKDNVDWDERKELFIELIQETKATNNSLYDCIIPVSGGKDSYYQTHIIKNILNLNPLLVTYNANNYSETGWTNLQQMKNVFSVDHLIFSPSTETLIKLNQLGMLIMGDMNWHAHCGIETYPIREAVEKNISLMIWGEHGFTELGGMHSYNDFVEFTYRYRHEHGIRGFEYYDMLAAAKDYNIDLQKKEMTPWIYPEDNLINKLNLRGIYISNYFRWEANEHTKFVIDNFGFKLPKNGFDRTYKLASNLDDIHENGVHDYMKYIKFGYGRATDHACKDIRAGIMTRDEAIAMVRKYDHVEPSDLNRWLDYVGWTKDYFYEVANRFRDSRVWKKDVSGNWIKDNI